MISVEENTSPVDQSLEDSLVTFIPDVRMHGSADKVIVEEVTQESQVVVEPTEKSVSTCINVLLIIIRDVSQMKRRLSFETEVSKTRQKLLEVCFVCQLV